MTTSILSFLRCPVCKQSFQPVFGGKTLGCTGIKQHTFDLAKSGYVNLARNGKQGDLTEAVRARSVFLEAGYYQPLADFLEEMFSDYGISSFLDAGCGEGYYTNRLAKGRRALGADLSKAGIDHAAKTAKPNSNDVCFLVASLFDLPVPNNSLDAVLNIFAPCAEQEFERILKPEGLLFLVGAAENHLMGLKKVLYDQQYVNPTREDLPKGMTLLRKERLSGDFCVESPDLISALFSMTPYYWRTSPTDRKKLEGLTELNCNYDFDVLIYQKKGY